MTDSKGITLLEQLDQQVVEYNTAWRTGQSGVMALQRKASQTYADLAEYIRSLEVSVAMSHRVPPSASVEG